jgi:HNH endonuclease
MRRLEFSARTKDEAAKRANGICEFCRLPFKGRPEFHHILEAALGGKPTTSNCLVVCKVPCHQELSAKGIKGIRKADRQRKASVGAKRETQKIVQRVKEEKPASDKLPIPPRRALYRKA